MRVLLKKYKDKLYTFLVLKNSAIASEYQSYVMADTERHEKHKLKSWLFLIKLNIKYRVLKGNTNLNQLNQPYIDGPESELSNRPLPIHLATKLMEYDVISFDIFDTLILRNLSTPPAVFDLVGEKLEVINFRTLRVQAEREARVKKTDMQGTREVTIFDIYTELYNMGIISDVRKAVATELEVESDMCFANPYMLQVYNILKDNGKKIYAVSDMYIPKQYMQQLLSDCGYDHFDDILVSCDYRASKFTTELFQVLKNKVGNVKIKHIGDNYASDIVSAKKMDIDTFYYRGVNSYGKSYRAYNLSSPIKEAYEAIVNNQLHVSNNSFSLFYEYGYVYGGLFLVGFVNYINKIKKLHKIDKILLLARDGFIISKVFGEYFPNEDIDYVYYSRVIALKACAQEDFNSYIDRVSEDSNVNRVNSGTPITFKELFSTMDIDISDSILHSYELSVTDIINSDTIPKLKQILLDNKNSILANYSKYRTAFKEYLSIFINNISSIVLVDIGWTGVTTTQLKKFIISNFHFIKNIEIIYTGANHMLKSSTLLYNESINCYIFANNYNVNIQKAFKTLEIMLFELFLTSPEPSIKSIDNNQFSFTSNESENKYITTEIQNGMLDFYKNYNQAFGKYEYLLNISGHDACAPFLFLKPNLIEYSKYFFSVVFSRSTISIDYCQLTTLKDNIKNSSYLSQLYGKSL